MTMRKRKDISESLMNPKKITFILSPTLFSSRYPAKRKKRYERQNNLYISPNIALAVERKKPRSLKSNVGRQIEPLEKKG